MLEALVDWIAPKYGYRKVPPRDYGRDWIELVEDPATLSQFGHKRRSRAFIGRKLANEANDALDRFEKFNA